jgi:DNA-binding response OmpR family regulator
MKKKKILIIDDEVDFGFLMKNFFSEKNYDVYVALTLRDGLKILKEENPDIVFLDNNLPDGFGWSETANILVEHPRVKLNLISALSVPKTSASSFQILEKPLRLEWLKEMAADGFSSRKN